ncbi:uncharacterized protein yc1106_00293 [Curvularia clavata]|uniref:BRCT domain-containing protein n=1 Tax=Curvularia clavata TaxID=95742 RepID=A0A9Q8YZR1_CURCL|nr:uncharacterized protein yc1106_00293 [Curvularia clavata]
MAESQAPSMLGEDLYDRDTRPWSPIIHVARLTPLQDPSQLSQALKQRACSDKPFRFTTSDESQYPDSCDPCHDAASFLDRGASPRRAVHANHVKPTLPKHHSAPTSTDLTKKPRAISKMHSFNMMDAPGDTQPDSQMLKTWTSGIYSTTDVNDVAHPKSLFVEHDEDIDEESPSDEMDIVASSQGQRGPAPTSPTVPDADEVGDSAQNSLAPTSPLKFQTPALVGRTRGNSGNMLSSAARTNTTPGTVGSTNFFFPSLSHGGEGLAQHISLTQAFNNTQAPTSPALGGGATDDIVFSRPSPNFTHIRHSSPIPAYSSPIKATQPETPKSDPVIRSSSQPRTEYVTMKESQERRKLSLGDEHGSLVEQDSWQELSRVVRAKKAKEYAHRQAARSLSSVSVPTPVLSRSTKKRIMNPDDSSPGRSKTPQAETNGGVNDYDVTMEEQSQHMGVNENSAEDACSLDVPVTKRIAGRRNSVDSNVQVPKTSSHPHRTPSCPLSRNSSQPLLLQREHQLQETRLLHNLNRSFQPHSSRESIAVMDSQPDVDFDSIPQPKSIRFPSSPSVIQYSINQTTMGSRTGYTSQIISSSMPPMPPKPSSPEEDTTPEGEERVPSSPPLLPPDDAEAGDDNIEYDEHTYDEYTEVSGQRNSLSPTFDDDVAMDEDEDLPVVKEHADENDGTNSDKEELDLVKPGKTNVQTDQVAEASEQNERSNTRSSNQFQRDATGRQPRPPCMQRQDTIPETDALDETQPSFFPTKNSEEITEDATATGDHTNSVDLSQIAREKPDESPPNLQVPISSKDAGSEAIPDSRRIRSVDDMYNLPDTQHSLNEEDVEMPRLSGSEDEGDVFMPRSSPAKPSVKRRRVMYTAKRKAFRDSTRTATDTESLSDPPSSSQLDQVQPAMEDNQPAVSAGECEDDGAHTAAGTEEHADVPFIRTTSLKSRVLPKPSKPRNQRQGALKPVSRELLRSVSSPAASPTRPKEPGNARKKSPITPTKSREAVAEPPTDVDMVDAGSEPVMPPSSLAQPCNIKVTVEIPSQRSATPPEIIVPNRVFASWPGSHYYPATCVGRPTARQLQIRFDDGNTTFIDTAHVRALDLRTGDHVKVDEPGMKKNTYIVVGFKDRRDDLGGEEFPMTDQRGHATVVLEERPRESLPQAKALQSAEHILVPMGSVYLTSSLWKRLRDRSFTSTFVVSPAKSASHIGTPIADPLTTPSFSRRGTAVPSFLRDATTRAASVASTARSSSGVFTNMAFVLTSTTADVDKDAIARLIKSNNGQVLEHGFHELFDFESEEAPTSSQNRRRSTSTCDGSNELVLKDAYKDLGFVALISDAHSRSTKYIQALALNVPCLHVRWIHDSLNASHAAPFTRYLLPAGVSKFLDPNGVIRSRTMAPYDPAGEDTTFARTIQGRDLLLRNQNVLLITGKSKKEIEKRQPFFFLSHALGSANVGRCADMAAASDMLSDGKWDWVYVDNGERGVMEAAAALFGTEKPAAVGGKTKKGGKKRKRDGEGDVPEELIIKGDIGGRTVKITCAEFVIQSLILGALIEE